MDVREKGTNLLALQIHNRILAAILKAILVRWNRVVDKKSGKLICAARVHQVGQELDELWPELFLALHVHIGEVALSHLSQCNLTNMLFILAFSKGVSVPDE